MLLDRHSDANARRAAGGAARAVPAVRAALSVLGDFAPAPLAAAGRLRLAHPTASLAELGQLADPQLSKNAVAGRLRRLLRAGRRAGKSAPGGGGGVA